MQEIVASVKRVTDIMGEISAASEEQSSGIDQVNRAVSQMDEVTQQNAALVEEAAAAAGARWRNRRSALPRRWRCSRSTPAKSSKCRRASWRNSAAPRVAARPAAAPAQPKEEPAIAPPVQEPAAEQAPVRAPARPAARLAHAAPRAAGGRGRHGGASRAPRGDVARIHGRETAPGACIGASSTDAAGRRLGIFLTPVDPANG